MLRPLFFLLLSVNCLSISSCKKLGSSSGGPRVKAHDTLSPSDLDIEKYRFTARPSKTEVAIFRTYVKTPEYPPGITYDQISWRGDGSEVHQDIVIIPRELYADFPQPDPKTAENIFRSRWRFRAGSYRYSIDDYATVGGSSSWGDHSDAEFERIYTLNTKTKSHDLVFNCRMFIVPLVEAERIHPELKKISRKDIQLWEASYHLEPAQR